MSFHLYCRRQDSQERHMLAEPLLGVGIDRILCPNRLHGEWLADLTQAFYLAAFPRPVVFVQLS